MRCSSQVFEVRNHHPRRSAGPVTCELSQHSCVFDTGRAHNVCEVDLCAVSSAVAPSHTCSLLLARRCRPPAPYGPAGSRACSIESTSESSSRCSSSDPARRTLNHALWTDHRPARCQPVRARSTSCRAPHRIEPPYTLRAHGPHGRRCRRQLRLVRALLNRNLVPLGRVAPDLQLIVVDNFSDERERRRWWNSPKRSAGCSSRWTRIEASRLGPTWVWMPPWQGASTASVFPTLMFRSQLLTSPSCR